MRYGIIFALLGTPYLTLMKLLIIVTILFSINFKGQTQDSTSYDTLRILYEDWMFKPPKNIFSVGVNLDRWSSEGISFGYERLLPHRKNTPWNKYRQKMSFLSVNYGFGSSNTNMNHDDLEYLELKEIFDSAVVYQSTYSYSRFNNLRIGITRSRRLFRGIPTQIYWNVHALIGNEKLHSGYEPYIQELTDSVSDSYINSIDLSSNGNRSAEYLNLGLGGTIGADWYIPMFDFGIKSASIGVFWNMATFGMNIKLKEEIFDDDDQIYYEPLKRSSSKFWSNIGLKVGFYI